MPSQNIQWFPGHMAKTRRMITENLKNVDAVIEILDARIPQSSRNPEISKLTGDKPKIVLMNKSSLADPEMTSRWLAKYTNDNTVCIECDCITGQGLNKIAPALKKLCHEKLERYESKGMTGRMLKTMVLGIPNVGKSSLINKICGGKRAKVENRPGVTLDKQWVATNIGIMLLDMPGILWPKFEDKIIGENLAITGAIKDDILDIETIATALCARLRKHYPELMEARYKISDRSSYEELNDYELLELIGRKRGFLISGGEIDTERTANMLIDEFRAAKIGRMTLDEI
ncbi:MAG: ribosome biogenesis GTPase YlqF [Ruminococcaceae bacterium]|nr:ribosome biogenesis GTPase YlqF [Oscillospiraceae bacterium]